MILNAQGLVLSRRLWREADRLAVLYTESLGKLTVRFVGASRPRAKLRALCEPLVWGEYRLYMSPSGESAKAIGGRIVDSFPSLREDFAKTAQALSLCEWLDVLTPERSPNPRKFALLAGALTALSEPAPSRWLSTAYGLQLLELCGFGLRDRALPGGDRALWAALHDAELGGLEGYPEDSERRGRFMALAESHAEEAAGRPLRTRLFSESLERARGTAVPA